MIRRLTIFATALSLIVFLTIVALWVRSYWFMDAWNWAGGRRSFSSQPGGVILFHHIEPPLHDIGFVSYRVLPRQRKARPVGNRFLGFAVFASPPSWSRRDQFCEVPDWFVALATSILPLLALRCAVFDRPKRRIGAGRCGACGYDLRASTERCPECGTAISRPAVSSSG